MHYPPDETLQDIGEQLRRGGQISDEHMRTIFGLTASDDPHLITSVLCRFRFTAPAVLDGDHWRFDTGPDSPDRLNLCPLCRAECTWNVPEPSGQATPAV
jgi:hypothetical protein